MLISLMTICSLLFVTKDYMKQFDPHWPFPQFDEDGVQLMPSETHRAVPVDLYEDFGEALL